MSWLGRSLGSFGSDLGTADVQTQNYRAVQQEMAIRAAREKLAALMGPLQVQQIQEELKKMQNPQFHGTVGTPGGGIGAVMTNPSGQPSISPLQPGMDKNGVKSVLSRMKAQAPKEYQPYLDFLESSLDLPGTDPQQVLADANKTLGQAASHQSVTGRLVKGDPVPDKNSITGYSRPMYDGQGNLVRTVPNVVIPGLMPKETEGWQVTTDADGNVLMVPKTTVTKPAGPGAHATSGGAPPGPGTAGPNAPAGSKVIGHKDSAIQRDAVVASKAARDAYSLKDDVEKNADAAKKGNPRASLALVFAAVRMMVQGAGRMTQVELQQEAKAGSLGQRIERWVQNATEGTLPDDQIEQIKQIVANGYESKRSAGQQSWEYAYPDRPLPPWLRSVDQGQKNIPPPTAPPPMPGLVVTPNG